MLYLISTGIGTNIEDLVVVPHIICLEHHIIKNYCYAIIEGERISVYSLLLTAGVCSSKGINFYDYI